MAIKLRRIERLRAAAPADGVVVSPLRHEAVAVPLSCRGVVRIQLDGAFEFARGAGEVAVRSRPSRIERWCRLGELLIDDKATCAGMNAPTEVPSTAGLVIARLEQIAIREAGQASANADRVGWPDRRDGMARLEPIACPLFHSYRPRGRAGYASLSPL